jgi:hypothetical protein
MHKEIVMPVESLGSLARSLAYHVRRREPRHISSVRFTLQRFLRFGPVVTQGVTLDVSVRGMSALVCGAPRVGETVVIELALRGSLVEMLATVRHSTNAKSGFEFYPLSPLAEQGIHGWVEDLRRHEETLFPYLHVWAGKSGSD